MTDFGTIADRPDTIARAFVGQGLTDTIAISWPAPPVDVVETKAKDFNDRLFAIANMILTERFSRAVNSPNSPFMEIGLLRQNIQGTARVDTLDIAPKAGQDQAAFAQGMAMLRSYLANGPTPEELARAILTYDRAYAGAAATARTLPSSAIADLAVEALATRGVMQSPVQAFADFEASKPAITPAAIQAVLGQVRIAKPAILWRQGETLAAFDEPAMLAAYRSAMAAPVTARSGSASIVWPYTQFGTPTAIVSRVAMPDVGATRVTFANGVVLTVKQTSFEDDVIHVAVALGNGKRGVACNDGAALFVTGQVGLDAGGLGKLTSDDIRQALAGKI